MPIDWPAWWGWDIEITPHLLKRMIDRGFTETDLRQMLDSAIAFRPAATPNRFVITCPFDAQPWQVVVEPDDLLRVLLIITAYRKETP